MHHSIFTTSSHFFSSCTRLQVSILLSSLLFISCQRPKAIFEIEQSGLTAPVSVQFRNLSGNAERYTWQFGDGEASDAADPSHHYLFSGRYDVTLTAYGKGKKSVIHKTLFIEAPSDCLIEMETSEGTILLMLYGSTPQHMDNFVKLASSGYYDGLLFHRVIYGFMIQGGDPDSRNAPPQRRLGGGGPDYTVPAELVDSLVHIKGALAAARTGDAVNPKKASSGSQFYIVHGKPVSDAELDSYEQSKGFRYSANARNQYLKVGGTPALDREYTVFGRVIKGLEVVDKIASETTGPGDRPVKDIKILKMTVIR